MRGANETVVARSVCDFRLIGEILIAVHITVVAIVFGVFEPGDGLLGVKAAGP